MLVNFSVKSYVWLAPTVLAGVEQTLVCNIFKLSTLYHQELRREAL